jgi:hypothetical protein
MQIMSIHIGLNEVDPKEYGGWRGPLRSCEADALAMKDLAIRQGMAEPICLLTAAATYARVMDELKKAAASLRRSDYLLLTFAGHGASYKEIPSYLPGQPPPSSPSEEGHDDLRDEDDGRDEAWCLYDSYLLDDELHDAFLDFAPGVCICVVSDSCFSGTVTRGDKGQGAAAPVMRAAAGPVEAPPSWIERRVPPRRADMLYRHHFRSKYASRTAAVASTRARRAEAHIVLLAACQDDQTASEGPEHGLFTEQLLAVWDGGTFTGSHRELVDAVAKNMANRKKSKQKPNLYITGAPNPDFQDTTPFRGMRPRS